MKLASALALAGLVSMSLAGPAAAFSFAPKSTSFTAAGPVTIAKPAGQIHCTVNAKGVVGPLGKAKLTSVAISGGDAACFNTAAQHLPWPAVATGAGAGKISHVVLIGAFTGTCGPGVVHITVSGAGLWSFSNAALPGGCVLTGMLATSPPITVVP